MFGCSAIVVEELVPVEADVSQRFHNGFARFLQSRGYLRHRKQYDTMADIQILAKP